MTARIDELRRRIAEAQNLDDVEIYFHTQLAEYLPFREAGHSAPNPKLLGLLRVTAKMRGASAGVVACNLMYVPRYSLWHGWVTFEDGGLAVAIYFEGAPRGFCTLANIYTGEVDLFRFEVPDEDWSPGLEIDSAEAASISRHQPQSFLN